MLCLAATWNLGSQFDLMHLVLLSSHVLYYQQMSRAEFAYVSFVHLLLGLFEFIISVMY